MHHPDSPYVRQIHECEAAIIRIREAIKAGQSESEAFAQDYELLQRVALPRFIAYARSLSSLGQGALEEAVEAMLDRLNDDLLKTDSFPSMATAFGAYLRDMPIRVLQRIRRKYQPAGVSFIESLDAVSTADGQSLHETLADAHAEQLMDVFVERETLDAALAHLPDPERHVMVLRLQGYKNNEIAERLGVSPATATRISQRAMAQLRRILGTVEE